MQELIKAFIQECIDVQDSEARRKTNYIEMHNYFKYSGQIEKSINLKKLTPKYRLKNYRK